MNRRTVVYYKDLLIGRDEFLVPLIKESLVVKSASYQGKSSVLSVMIENNTQATFILRNKTEVTFHSDNDVVTLKPGDDNLIEVKTKEKQAGVKLTFEILNAVNAPGMHPTVSWEVRP
jgi:hypothetical protein